MVKHANGPWQLWATCESNFNKYSVAFVGSCFDGFLNHGRKCEDKVLFGAIACRVQGEMEFFRIIRYGKKTTAEQRQRAQVQKIIPFEEVFEDAVGELELDPDCDDRQPIIKEIARIMECKPSDIRV
jgi:hypothetical protein